MTIERTQEQRLAQIRIDVAEANVAGNYSGYYLENQDVAFLLQVITNLEARNKVQAASIAEYQAECKKLNEFNDFTVKVAQDEIAAMKARSERRAAEVRELVAAVRSFRSENHGYGEVAATLEQALETVRRWLK